MLLVVWSLLNPTSNNSQLPGPLEKLQEKPEPMFHGMELLWVFVVLVRSILGDLSCHHKRFINTTEIVLAVGMGPKSGQIIP